MDELWTLLRGAHLLAMAFFVGGQLFLVAALVPVERKVPEGERMRAVARRFAYGTLVAVGVLLATGAALASHFDQWAQPVLHAKLALVAIAAGLVVWHIRRPSLRALEGAIFVLSLLIVWLGLVLAH